MIWPSLRMERWWLTAGWLWPSMSHKALTCISPSLNKPIMIFSRVASARSLKTCTKSCSSLFENLGNGVARSPWPDEPELAVDLEFSLSVRDRPDAITLILFSIGKWGWLLTTRSWSLFGSDKAHFLVNVSVEALIHRDCVTMNRWQTTGPYDWKRIEPVSTQLVWWFDRIFCQIQSYCFLAQVLVLDKSKLGESKLEVWPISSVFRQSSLNRSRSSSNFGGSMKGVIDSVNKSVLQFMEANRRICKAES